VENEALENEDCKMKSAAVPTPYTLNHPRWYRKRVSTYWWLQRWEYLRFVLREISSVFIAIFVVETLFQIYALSRGPEAYAIFLSVLKNPFIFALNIISFLFVVFHSITWFNLSARAMSIRVGGKKVPGFMISGPNFVAWFVISGFIAWLLLRG
jgi:fumarate reductase subunit C